MTGAEWRLVILLVLSIFINYVDRGNLSIAAPLLEKEMHLSPRDLGTLLSAFFWTYALFQLFGIAGWLADRFPVGWVFAAGFFAWSASTALTGMVTGFTALFLMRLLLGIGESLAYPCYSKMLTTGFPEEHRGFANALIDAGSKVGPGLGTFIGGLLVASVGWRWFFIVLGIGSLLWLIPWLIWMPQRYKMAAAINVKDLPSVAQILAERSAWGTFLGHFCGNYFWYFLLTWLPLYLTRERHFSMEGMAKVGSIAYFAIAGATVTAGWISDRLISSGRSATKVRKSISCGGLVGSTIILPVVIVNDLNLSITLLMMACISFGVYTSNHWAMVQTLAGPLAAGRWTSLMNGVGNLAGIVAAWLTGYVVNETNSFFLAFVISAAVVLTGAAMWAFVVGEVKEVQWHATRRT